MGLADEKYISVTTYRKSGEGVATPTWVAPLEDGRIGFWTSSQSGKAKRLRNIPRVTVQPCDARGKLKPDSQPVEATASIVDAGPVLSEVRSKVKAKYGVMVPISRVLNTIGHIGKKFPYGDIAVVIAL